ncbi:MAG: hypothetical protein ABR981_03610 [Candidatus Micrarchaeaceae archaeon]
MAKDSWDIGATIALIGSFIVILYSIYYMQSLSYAFGVYSGISRTISSYNITASSTVLAALSQSTTITLALHLTYVMIAFALVMAAVSMLWFFSKSYARYTPEVLIICSIIYAIIAAILEYNFNFSNSVNSYGSFIGAILIFTSGVYFIVNANANKVTAKRSVSQISINPDTPYSNIKIISNKLMSKLNGDIKILDMHFDAVALDNLMQLLDKNMGNYTQIEVLAKKDRLGDKFTKLYKDFKAELNNKNIQFELRVLSEKDALKQHERVIMDNSTAYKIPPLNIINKKNEHIVAIKYDEASRKFNDLWAEAQKYENMLSESNNLQ